MSSTDVTVYPWPANKASAASTIRRRRRSTRASRRSWAEGTAIDLAGCERPRDDQALDLAGAFEEGVDLGVAVPFPAREVAAVAVAAADLDRLLGDLDRHLAGLQLGHGAVRLGELAAIAALPQRPPDQGARGLDLGRHVREHESDRLVLDQRAPELLALLGVVKGELKRGARDAQRLGADDRPRQLERLQSHRRTLVGAFLGALQPGLQLLHAAEHVLERNRAVLEQHLGGVRGADAHLLFLLAHAQAFGPGRHYKAGLPAGPQLGFHRRHDDVDVGDPAVGDENLLAVDDPVAVLADGAGLHRRDVGAGVWLGPRQGAQGRLLRSPEAGRDPGRDLLWRALGEDRRHRQARALDGHRDARAAPGQLLGDERGHDARAVAVRLLQELGAVEPDLGRVLDDRPGEFLGFVVLVGLRADFLLREAMDPVSDLLLLVAQLERNHVCPRAPGVLTHQYSYVPFPKATLRRGASPCQLP